MRVAEAHLGDKVCSHGNHEDMQGVLHDSKALDGSALLLLCLVYALDVIEIVSLLVQIDRPILKVCVQFKHDQG